MRSRPLESCSIIRVQSWNGALAPSAVEQLLGVRWPKTIGAVASGRAAIICVGPTDWRVIAADPDFTPWLQQLDAAFEGSAFRATDVSQALARIEIDGPEARELLAKGCSLDLYPPLFPPGRSARTRFAGMPVVVRCLRHSTFECIVPVSYADYFLSWLEDAALEFVTHDRNSSNTAPSFGCWCPE
jgi:sarcosine oxidase subunit gamma